MFQKLKEGGSMNDWIGDRVFDDPRDLISAFLKERPTMFMVRDGEVLDEDHEVLKREDTRDLGFGSIMYATGFEAFRIYWEARNTLSDEEVQKAFGIESLRLGTVKNAAEDAIEQLEDKIENLHYWKKEIGEFDEEYFAELTSYVEELSNYKEEKADRIFWIYRNTGWFLNDAAPSIAKNMFLPDWIDEPEESGGLELGISIALLVEYDFIDSIKCCQDFDT